MPQASAQHDLDSLIELYIVSDEKTCYHLYFDVGFDWSQPNAQDVVQRAEARVLKLEAAADTQAVINLRQILVDAYEKWGRYAMVVEHNMALRTIRPALSQYEGEVMYGMLRLGLQKQGRYQDALLMDEEARKFGFADAKFGQTWMVKMELGLTREALDEYRASMRNIADTLLPFWYSSYLNNQGIVLHRGYEYDSALYFFEAASHLLDSIIASGHVEGTSLGYARFFAALVKGNIGQVYADQGQYERALAPAREAATAGLKYEVGSAMSSLVALADILQHLNLNKESLAPLLRLDSLLRAGSGNVDQQTQCYRLLANYYESEGRYAQAATYYASLTQYSDSINRIKNADQILAGLSSIDLQASREQERIRELDLVRERTADEQRKAQRNALLGGVAVLLILAVGGLIVARQQVRKRKQLAEKNDQIEAQASLIQVALKEKEQLLREIHHRIKNNLQIVGGILKMHARKSGDPEVNATMEEARNKLQVIALIHQQLYQSEGLSNIPLQDYVERLCNKLLAAMLADGQHVNLLVECGTRAFDADTTVPLGLIVNEVITNSLKYGLSHVEQGQLHLSMSEKESGKFVLRIADNGPGFPENFDPKGGKSLGVLLINGLSGQLNGHAEFSNESGAVVRILFAPDPA